MNTLKRFLMAGWLGLMPVLAGAEIQLPQGSAGAVTLDWQKFNELWTKMQDMEKEIVELKKPDQTPPVPFTVTKAAYKGTIQASRILMDGVFELDVYDSKEWVKIPFLPSSVAITEARLDGQPVGVIQAGGFHQIVLKKPGRHVLRASFSMKAPKAEEAPQFSLQIQETPITYLALEFHRPQLDVTIEPSGGTETHALGQDRTRVTAALPPTSTIQVRWQKASPEEIAGPAKQYVDAQQLITVSEGMLKSHWELNYSILHKGVRQIQLQVPEAWNILAVNCDGMQEWKMVKGTKGPELQVQLAYARRGNLVVSVEAEKGLGEKDDTLEFPRLIPLNVEREQGTVGVEAKGAVELQVATAEGLHAIDPKELPAGLWRAASQPILFAFRYTKPYALAVSLTRHPEVAVLSTTIDDANGVTVLTPRGQMITKVSYQVRNQLKQYLSITLPKESELWSAFVAGEPVKPTRAEDGTYRIPLAKSQLGNQGQQGFPVELIYFRRVPKFVLAGRRAMTLPMPDAPVSRMLWSVYLPEKYRFPYFGGDVEKGELARSWGAVIGGFQMRREDIALKSKKLEAPQSMARDIKNLALAFGGSKSADAIDEMVVRQSEVAAELFNDKERPVVSGIFPVAFELPAAGQMFNFGQVMIVGQDPTLTLWYAHARIIQILVGIVLGLAAFALGRMLYRRRMTLLMTLKWLASNLSRVRSLVPAGAAR